MNTSYVRVLKKIFRRLTWRDRAEKPSFIEPYRDWSLLLIVTIVSICVGVGFGISVFQEISVAHEEQLHNLEDPRSFIDPARLNATLEAAHLRQEQYRQLHGTSVDPIE